MTWPTEIDEMKTNEPAKETGPAAGEEAVPAAKAPKPVSARKIDELTDAALAAIKNRAAELNITGVAVVAYAQGDSIQDWTSKMAVVGRMKIAPSTASRGNNFLAVAYAKAAEMADTLENSGTAKRPPMIGELGWRGGLFARVKTGCAIVAFSGASADEDVEVSQAGLEVLKAGL
ncbi:MAG: hypothetical protein ABSD43_02135 [Terracidiphilus sp.]|jgi:hypothetical protein